VQAGRLGDKLRNYLNGVGEALTTAEVIVRRSTLQLRANEFHARALAVEHAATPVPIPAPASAPAPGVDTRLRDAIASRHAAEEARRVLKMIHEGESLVERVVWPTLATHDMDPRYRDIYLAWRRGDLTFQAAEEQLLAAGFSQHEAKRLVSREFDREVAAEPEHVQAVLTNKLHEPAQPTDDDFIIASDSENDEPPPAAPAPAKKDHGSGGGNGGGSRAHLTREDVQNCPSVMPGGWDRKCCRIGTALRNSWNRQRSMRSPKP